MRNSIKIHCKQFATLLSQTLLTLCFAGALLLAFGCAFAWLTDSKVATSSYQIEVGPEKPFAAVYRGNGQAVLLIDRANNIPNTYQGLSLTDGPWRGLEEGDQSFGGDNYYGGLPWYWIRNDITRLDSGSAAKEAPIVMADISFLCNEMKNLVSADVGGIRPALQDINGKNCTNVLRYTFAYCQSLKEITGLHLWDVSKAQSMFLTFYECSSLENLDLSFWNTASLDYMNQVFHNMKRLQTLNVAGWNVSKVKESTMVFTGCSMLRSIEGIDDWDFSSNTNINALFAGCSLLERINTSKWRMFSSTLSDISNAFDNCPSLEEIDLSGLRINAPWLWYRDQFAWTKKCKLKTIVFSNRTVFPGNVYQGPSPCEPENSNRFEKVFPSWKLANSSTYLGKVGITQFLENHYTSNPLEPVQTYTFVACLDTTFNEEEVYAAYYRNNYSGATLLIDKGSTPPSEYNGSSLSYCLRKFWLDDLPDNKWADQFYSLAEVHINVSIQPTSTKRWFARDSLQKIYGLENLDMRFCVNVEKMFNGSYNLHIPSFNGSMWSMNPKVTGYTSMFTNSGIEVLDLRTWDFMKEAVDFREGNSMYLSKILLPPQSTVWLPYETQYKGTSTKYYDSKWYINGTGKGLSNFEVFNYLNNENTSEDHVVIDREYYDRSYAALYGDVDSLFLIMGRGLEIPNTYQSKSLYASYRGLEEDGLFDFRDKTKCPWESFAEKIVTVDCTEKVQEIPLVPPRMNRWFLSMASIERFSLLEKGGVNPEKCKDAAWMFYYCTSLKEIPETFTQQFSESLKDTSQMFAGCKTLIKLSMLPASATKNIYDASRMFEECRLLPSIDISFWDISSLRYCSGMFQNCISATAIKVPEGFINPSRSEGLQLLFAGCKSLLEIDASSWNLSSSSSSFWAFSGCNSLQRIIGAENWNTQNLENVSNTFSGCNALSLDCSRWNVVKIREYSFFNYDAPMVIPPSFGVTASSIEEAQAATITEDAQIYMNAEESTHTSEGKTVLEESCQQKTQPQEQELSEMSNISERTTLQGENDIGII